MNEFGKLVSVVGPVADVWFEHTPPLHQLLYALSDKNKPVPLEVVSHQGEGRVRCIALGATEGMYVGQPVENTGGPITAPVGEAVLGRTVNALGDPIDGKGPIQAERHSIHQAPPPLAEQTPATQMFETGIKVIDLLAPYARGGKIGLFGGAGVGKTVLIME